MNQTFTPPHPGEILREDVLPALKLTVSEAAQQLGVSTAELSGVLDCRAGISPDMALRIEGWLGGDNGGLAEEWLAMQSRYDLWAARQKGAPKVERARMKQ